MKLVYQFKTFQKIYENLFIIYSAVIFQYKLI